MVLAVVDDLLFSSKIRAVADRTGRPTIFVRTRSGVLPGIRLNGPDLVIIDLDRATLEPMDVIRDIKSQPDLGHVKVIGFFSHVNADVMADAKDAGIDLVLARSAFVTRLPELLAAPTA